MLLGGVMKILGNPAPGIGLATDVVPTKELLLAGLLSEAASRC